MPRKRLSSDKIMELASGFMASKVLLSAIELGLFSELAKGPLDSETLRKRLKLHPRSATDFFDTLVSLGMLRRRRGKYSNTPETDFFLDREKPSYIGGWHEMLNARLYQFWGSLTEALLTGKPQNEIKGGQDHFSAVYSDPTRLRIFMHAMTGLSMDVAKALAKKFPWSDHDTFFDIGTAEGGVPVQIALKHKHLMGGGFDLPVVKPIFEAYVKSFGLEKRLRFVAGNFFNDPLPMADVLIMGHVLHDWNLDEKMMLLKKAYKALPRGGSLIVQEKIIDDERRKNTAGLLMSLNMLIETQGGFDFTGRDCCNWMREVGFKKTEVIHLVGPESMVVGIK